MERKIRVRDQMGRKFEKSPFPCDDASFPSSRLRNIRVNGSKFPSACEIPFPWKTKYLLLMNILNPLKMTLPSLCIPSSLPTKSPSLTPLEVLDNFDREGNQFPSSLFTIQWLYSLKRNTSDITSLPLLSFSPRVVFLVIEGLVRFKSRALHTKKMLGLNFLVRTHEEAS